MLNRGHLFNIILEIRVHTCFQKVKPFQNTSPPSPAPVHVPNSLSQNRVFKTQKHNLLIVLEQESKFTLQRLLPGCPPTEREREGEGGVERHRRRVGGSGERERGRQREGAGRSPRGCVVPPWAVLCSTGEPRDVEQESVEV